MPPIPEHYLAILKASYDYQPQSDDEIAIKEDQLLFLKERTDDDWWKVKVKAESQQEDGPVGLVPAAYVEQAEHKSVVKALYDYDATAPGELSIKEDEVLLVFDTEEEWILVQAKDGSKAGYVPGNYVEVFDQNQQTAPAPQIVVPPSPPRPSYSDPADLVASTKVNADDIKTWAVSEVDKKGKKKKGTLGVGNGAVFFASEADKTPVQKWQTSDVENVSIEKSKHVHIDIGGANAISLHFNAGSKDIAEEIASKLASSKSLSTKPGPSTLPQETPRSTSKKPSVHFSQAEPDIIPPREVDSEDEYQESDQEPSQGASRSSADTETAVALYDFTADGDDELTVKEGERLVVLEKDGDEWWKCRNARGLEGVVPASYLDASSNTERGSSSNSKPDPNDEEQSALALAEQERMEAERQKKLEHEREQEKERKKAEAQEKAKKAAAEQERKKAAAAAAVPKVSSPPPTQRPDAPTSDKDKKPSSSTKEKDGPPPDQVRTWHDRSGQFRVDAAFLGWNNGKLRLHKTNGVIVEVPSEKMSTDDLRYVERLGKKSAQPPTPARRTSDDDVPLAQRQAAVKKAAAATKKAPQIDWFDFFLSAGCDVDDCTRYAASFERDKIDESLLPDITESTMRSLGLREGDIIRVMKAIEKRKPTDNLQKPNAAVEAQILQDAELARQLQAKEYAGKNPAPNLFAGPGGVLKNPRRGRPQPTKSLPANVDINALTTASEQIQRTSSPQLQSPVKSQPIPNGVQPPPRSSSALPSTSGFDDDAWTNRPSSTKPTPSSASPPANSPSTLRTGSAPPAAASTQTTPAAPASTQPEASIPPKPSTPSTAPAQATAQAPTAPAPNTSSTQLAKTTESDIFDQLARLSELRKNSSAPNTSPGTPNSVPSPAPGVPVASPLAVASYQAGLGMSASPLSMGQHIQNQQSGLLPGSPSQQYNGPRGPFAPVPANQALLQPLIPTQTGFSGFVPARPAPPTISPFQAPPPVPSQPAFLSQPPPPILNTQPLLSQPTGSPFGSGSVFQGPGTFNPIQPQFTSINPPLNNTILPSPVPPLPNTQNTTNTSPANVFAQMKSGTFATENDPSTPQSADRYNALRTNPLTAQPTGWGQPYQGGYMGFQH
ncbi:hypothetical protein AX16_003184 [Volvariella volvacea WC 439]|nr:hypothetical protein AX16_003184 [Volvariella volvacea WC 439]